jgi:hypothetical protein
MDSFNNWVWSLLLFQMVFTSQHIYKACAELFLLNRSVNYEIKSIWIEKVG